MSCRCCDVDDTPAVPDVFVVLADPGRDCGSATAVAYRFKERDADNLASALNAQTQDGRLGCYHTVERVPFGANPKIEETT